MKNIKGVPPELNGVPPKREKIHQFEGIDPSHESYVYLGVSDVNVILIFSFGVPPSDAI